MVDYSDLSPDGRPFSEHLQKERADRNVSRSELADRIGVSKLTIKNWEDGFCRPNRGNLQPLKRWLDDTPLRVEPEQPHEAATPLALTGVRELDRVTFTLRYRLPDEAEPSTLRFTGDAYDVIENPEWTDLDLSHGGTAYYLRSDFDPADETLIAIDGDNRLVDVEIGPDGDRQPVVALELESFARSDADVPHPGEYAWTARELGQP